MNFTSPRLLKIALRRKIEKLNAAYDFIAYQAEELESLYEEIDGTNAMRDEVVANLIRQRDEALAELRKLKRALSTEPTYGKDAIAGFSGSTPNVFVEMAESNLDAKGRVSFAAACAVALKRELDAAKARIAELSKLAPRPKAASAAEKFYDDNYRPPITIQGIDERMEAVNRYHKAVQHAGFTYIASTDAK